MQNEANLYENDLQEFYMLYPMALLRRTWMPEAGRVIAIVIGERPKTDIRKPE
jgi:hypothetical protein